MHHGTPPTDIQVNAERSFLDIGNLSIQDLSDLWGSLDGEYLPSILYRVRVVAFDTEDIVGRIPVVSEPKSTVR
ncbi:Pvc16 family protein [Nitrosomonas sp. Nm84]|uniref:Pvc16 family protein n=1 Tax=Nitrosomonas sp. Nm84 TaxID=200124 RepID=UPI001404D29D|nr:Pvc16 family protein [Nitrosomonas sp. Nm84]